MRYIASKASAGGFISVFILVRIKSTAFFFRVFAQNEINACVLMGVFSSGSYRFLLC